MGIWFVCENLLKSQEMGNGSWYSYPVGLELERPRS
jgi:hypothetical protein